MKASEFRGMSVIEVRTRLEELLEEGFNLRFQQAAGHLTGSARLRDVRRDVARVRTVLREHDLGTRKLAEGAER